MDTVHPKATRREWVGLGVIALACVLYVMDLTILHLAVPSISRDLRPTSTQLLWIIDLYGCMVAGSLITMGSLGDRIGRRRLLLTGAAAFGAASVLAALSSSAEMLIATRALLGIAGATLAPSTLSLIRNMFLDPRERTTAVAVWITSFSVGGAIGPLLGGAILEFFWWGAAFLVAVPVMALLLVLGPRLLPEYRDPDAGRADVPSAVLSLAAVLSLIFGSKEIAQDGIGPVAVASIVAAIAFAFVFARRQRRLDDPLIDLRLFRIPAFSASLATYGLGILIVFGGFLFIPQYLQLVRGMSPLEAGLWTLPWSLAFVVGSMVTPKLARSVRASTLMAVGLVAAAVGFSLFIGLGQVTSLATVVTGSVLFALGMGPVFTVTNDLIIGSAPAERAGAAAGISETAAELGGALGIALFGSIGIALYRGAMRNGVPSDVSPAAAEASRDTLGGAVEVATRLPDRVGSTLVDAAREAFLRGLRVSAVISAVGTLALAFGVLTLLRRLGVETAAAPHGDADAIATDDTTAV
ncbi:MAG TPA: MFS transporter [Actinomycetota bacterium]|nr:MFS transporter [Actinomycetota bacterium]